MKKIYIPFLCAIAARSALGASSTADMSSPPAKKEKYETVSDEITGGPARIKSSADLYYVSLTRRGGGLYKDFNGCGPDGCEGMARSARAESKKTADNRKYNLNNPFYQPLTGQFASITDLSYSNDSLDFKIYSGQLNNHTGNYSAGITALAETASFGITDTVMIMAAATFSHDSLNLQWDYAPDDYENASGVSQWGVGLRWRFANGDDWIANAMLAYQGYKDLASSLMGEAKLGYKNDDTMIYGFARAYMMNWRGIDSYGIGAGNYYFTQKEGVQKSLWYDSGIGLFAAMNSDWSADLQVAYSDGEWHQQLGATATISYQPWKSAAVSVWGSMALWDSADGFDNSNVYWGGYNYGASAFSNYGHYAAGASIAVVF